MSFTTDFWNSYLSYFDRMREQRAHRRTLEEVSKLPPHLRRDIGWPGAYERDRARKVR